MLRPADRSLPLAEASCERTDAARNRRRLLVAARRIIERDGLDQLTMQGLADEAEVGKGTVFRRFTDRSGLLHALLDDDERRFQQELIDGEPPLGPGAAPGERLVAFGLARIDFVMRHGDVLRAADASSCATAEHPVHSAHRIHLNVLLTQAGLPPERAAYLATTLLAALDAGTVIDQLDRDGLTVATVQDGWRHVVRALVA